MGGGRKGKKGKGRKEREERKGKKGKGRKEREERKEKKKEGKKKKTLTCWGSSLMAYTFQNIHCVYCKCPL